MFGKNPKRGAVGGSGDELLVQSIFHTLQGEGPNVGVSSVSVRLGGCNLACSFCDTEFENYSEIALEDILGQINKLATNSRGQRTTNLVVITGGEPFRQPIDLLCQQLVDLGYRVQIETNGTIYRDVPPEVEIICSPKVIGGKYHMIRPDMLARVNALKFIVSASLLGYDSVAEVGQSTIDDPIEIYVQPMDQYDEKLNEENNKHTLKLALENGYRFSLQTHKIIGIE